MIAIDIHTPHAFETISISDMTGRKLIEKVVPGAYHIVIETGMLAPGVYITSVNDVLKKNMYPLAMLLLSRPHLGSPIAPKTISEIGKIAHPFKRCN